MVRRERDLEERQEEEGGGEKEEVEDGGVVAERERGQMEKVENAKGREEEGAAGRRSRRGGEGGREDESARGERKEEDKNEALALPVLPCVPRYSTDRPLMPISTYQISIITPVRAQKCNQCVYPCGYSYFYVYTRMRVNVYTCT